MPKDNQSDAPDCGSDNPDWALIERIAGGSTSLLDHAALEKWVGGSSTRRQTVSDILSAARATQAQRRRYDPERGWDMVGGRLRGRGSRVRRGALVTAAASVTIGLLAFGWRTMMTRKAPLTLAESIATGPRQRASLQLRDGSRVVLAPESRLVEMPQFGVSAREVELDGGAYFDVVHDPSRPFVVIAGEFRIHDLGTQFAIDAYRMPASAPGRNEAVTEAQVAVTSGSVEIERVAAGSRPGAHARNGAAPPSVVTAGYLGRVGPGGRITVVRAFNIDQYVSWTRGDLTFGDVPFGRAIPRLERWYGVSIVLGDPALACRHISATFRDESVAQVLEQLSLALHVRYRWSGTTVILEPKGAPASPLAGNDRTPAASSECPSDSRSG